MKQEPDVTKDNERSKRRGFFYWIGRFFLLLIILFFGILIMIQLPPVQMWGARFMSKKISKSLNATVTIGGFNLHPISDLSLENVFIGSPDHPGDTLIRAKTLNVDFQRLWDLLQNKITVNQVVLDDAFLNIEKKAGDTLTNLDLAMLRLLPEKDTSRAAFVLDLEKISGTSLNVRINDNTKGSWINMLFDRVDIALDTLDMEGQYISADFMDFDNPLIYVTQKVTEPVTRSSVEKENKSWSFDIGTLNWTDGKIYIDNQNKPHDTSQVYGIDYAHLVLADVDLRADSLSIRGWNVRGKDINLHVLHQNGFEIEKAAASSAEISEKGINLSQFEIRTPDSHIKNSVQLTFNGFDDFKSFADSVVIDIPQADIDLHLKDLLAIVPSLGKVSFFSDNKNKVVTLRGNINGYINRLRILDMTGGMGGISLTGDLRSRDLAVKGSQLISLDLNHASFSAKALEDIFPRMKIPALFDRLGSIQFTGKFDGYPDDFVAFGNFQTGLGAMTMDMNLNFVKGIANARYSGTLSMDNFDLGTFIGNKDIGRTTMTGRIIEGTGLTAETVNADITAVMSYVVYQGYTYRNARLDGQISGRQFVGTMDVNDPNVDMHFEGIVDFTQKKPKLDFVSRIDSIRFLPLGFGDQPITLSGFFDVDLTAGSIDEFKGTLRGENVVVRIKDEDYHLDSLLVDALIDSVSGDRFYNIQSDVVSGVMSGEFNPVTIASQVQQYLHQHYPSTIGPPKAMVSMAKPPRVSWDIRIHDSGPWLDVAGFKGLVLRNTYTHGSLDLGEQTITGFIDLPEIHYAGVNVYGSSINFDEKGGHIDADLEVIAADLKENLFFEDVFVATSGTDDSLRFRIQTDHIAEIIDELDVEILADPRDGNWAFSINPIRLEMLGDAWMIPPGNIVEIRKKEFNLENFELVSGERRIVIDDINNQGLEAFITGFDVNYLNELWLTDKFEFSGVYTLDLEVDNVFDIQQLSTVIHVPEMKVNNIPYGEWIFNAAMNDPADSVRIDLEMRNNETHLTGKGAFLPPIKSIPKEKQNYLRLALVANEFPLDFLEFLLGGNIRDTEGSVDMTLNLEGRVDRLNPNGKGKVYNGSTTIDYLGTAYSFHDQSFTITETMIDLSGTKLYDVQGNVAYVEGGLTHRYLKDLGLNATVTSDKILALDVTSEENSSFYGVGIGSVNAEFSGTVANPNMTINAQSAEGTHIYIPLSGGVTTSDKDFVIFLENGKLPASRIVPFNLSGINMTMNLNITREAIVEIIFDDATGEVLRAIGEGSLQINMSRTGNLTMYGGYEILEGDYLFTNFAVVRKPFELLPGGQINWDGDPYQAQLDVRARYKGLTAPVFNLIAEYLVGIGDNEILADARDRTDVDLTMTLTGSLQQPNISFDISFPNLTGQVKAYADSKVNLLRANQNAMLEQVVGLLITRSFLPPSSGFGAGYLSKGIDNTLSELISTTLSSYLSGLLGDIIPTGQFINSVEFQVDLDIAFTDATSDPLEDANSESYRVSLPIELFNSRLSVNFGGNYVTGSSFGEAGEYFAGDVAIEYDLTPDGRLKFRAYNRANELSFEGRKNKVGVGLAYRQEYDSFRDIFSRKRKKKVVPDPPPPQNEGG